MHDERPDDAGPDRELKLSEAGPALIHDLNNAMQGFELLDLEPALSPDTRDVMARVRIRLADLLRDLQLYVDAAVVQTQPLRADTLMDAAMAWLRDRRGGHVMLTPAEDWGAVVGDEKALVIALGHALSWLARRSPTGSVHLAAWSTPVKVGFAITAYDVRPIAHVASVRLERETGLERAIADRIAQAHGGWLRSERHGDSIELTLAISRVPFERAE
ncbi:MAG TPA: hypothetical protein VK427_18495 [Kofleriaceae bacterium]|nr:hypothetical protein [Kofleriaceae bacterium]